MNAQNGLCFWVGEGLDQALRQHGAAAGAYLAAARVVRCHPWCDGGIDEVPAEKPRLFSHLISPSPTKKSS